MVSVTMPKLGESVVEGTVIRWLKAEGEGVAKYEPLVEVMTDKVNSEVPSPEAGVVVRIAVPEGQTVKVGTEIAVIEAAGAPAGAPASLDGPPAGAGVERPPVELPTGEGAERPAEAGATIPAEEGRPRTSPLVRRLAREHGVDVSQIRGTGAGGRVRKEDMLAYLEARAGAAPVAGEGVAVALPQPATLPPAAGAPPAPPRPAPAPGLADEEVLPLSPLRRAIAEHMVRSATTAPHAWTYVEVDVSGLVRWREAERAAFRAREGFDLSFVPFVAKAVVESLREYPILNSTWRDGQVVLKRRIHLGVAVAQEDGLVVPVVRDADAQSIAGLARTLHDLVTRARAGKLTPEDVQGGTFTLNNTGALGTTLSMPIINQPQAAILTMEAITKRVVALPDDAIAVRPILNLCLSFDHRVCDGLPVGRFLQALKGRLEALAPGQSIY
jgi:pyruvate/2-oxoglutarate dehydrogenase complex dihydrolipoamide acyltransferase (E2) component